MIFFSIIEFMCIPITTVIRNFTRVKKMHMKCVAIMKNEYTHICSKRLKGRNFKLHIPHVKHDVKF